MISPQSESRITVACPSGHRLRGTTNMVGSTVKCPRCQSYFVFAPTKPTRVDPAALGGRSVTDTGVMRILGDMSPPASEPNAALEPAPIASRGVTDTRVMRILGDVSQSPPRQKASVAMLPCSRCGVPIPESAAVCSHCHCYVGVLPAFMQQLTEGNRTH